jgi:hypothetical protein
MHKPKLSFPPKERRSPTGGHAQIKLLQYAWTSLKYPVIKGLFLPREQTSQDVLTRPHFKGSL